MGCFIRTSGSFPCRSTNARISFFPGNPCTVRLVPLNHNGSRHRLLYLFPVFPALCRILSRCFRVLFLRSLIRPFFRVLLLWSLRLRIRLSVWRLLPPVCGVLVLRLPFIQNQYGIHLLIQKSLQRFRISRQFFNLDTYAVNFLLHFLMSCLPFFLLLLFPVKPNPFHHQYGGQSYRKDTNGHKQYFLDWVLILIAFIPTFFLHNTNLPFLSAGKQAPYCAPFPARRKRQCRILRLRPFTP